MAAEFTLNIYGENDEIVKTYETNHIKWRLFTQAIKLQDNLKDKEPDEQLDAISKFMTYIFSGLTVEELDDADAFDIFSTFRQLTNKAKLIQGSQAKN